MSGEAALALQHILGGAASITLPHPRSEYWRWSNLDMAVRQSLQGIAENAQGVALDYAGLEATGAVKRPLLAATKGHALFALAQAAVKPETCVSFQVEAGSAANLTLTVKAGSGVSASHVIIDIADGAKLTLAENWQAGTGASVHVREFRLGKGAKLNRIVLLPEGEAEARVLPAFVETGDGAEFRQTVLDLGGLLSRMETQVQTAGTAADIRLNHAYLLRDKLKADQTSQVIMDHEHTKVRQLVKGVVTDRAEAVFQGKFLVNRPAQHTDAKMVHQCLLLSEQGRVRAKPELEIYADDVECAHGNTTGMLDTDSLFYMRQRGLSEQQARALLMRAFISEVFDGLTAYEREALEARMIDWLEANQ